MDKLKELVNKWHIYGLKIPLISDPKLGRGSVSLTLVFISFNFCLISMAGKWSGAFGGVDPSQALNLFMVCAGLYWGRKFNKSSSGDISVEHKEEK